MDDILKYPRTRHIAGSKEQFGDEDLDTVPLKELIGKYLVVEEKMDGANSGVSFSPEGRLILQSRGHVLSGGPREKQFDRFKTWAHIFRDPLWALLGQRYIMYGEWLYAKHTVYYDALPHYFMEFDIFDRQSQVFLSTRKRREMLAPFPFIHSVRVITEGICSRPAELKDLVGLSCAITGRNRENLIEQTQRLGLKVDQVLAETDLSTDMEGLYIKEEDEMQVLNRYKYVRGGFLSVVFDSESHWFNRPIVPNRLQNERVMVELDPR